MDATAAPAGRTPGVADVAFPATRAGAVRIALAVHLVGLGLATVLGIEDRGAAGLDVWLRWDTTHYVRIAAEGYPPPGTEGGPLMSAFLPLYPLAIRGVALAVGSPLAAGLLVSLVAAIVASAALFDIVARDAGGATARRAVAWLNLYPTSFFLVAAYTEALFVALVLVCFLAARRDRFVAASLAAAGAGAARITGIAVLPALALEACLVARERSDGRLARRALPVALLAPLGTAAYLAMNFAVYGHAFEFLRHQETHWQHVPSAPWKELWYAAYSIANEPLTVDRLMLADSVAWTIVLLAAAAAFAVRRLRPSYAVYAIAAAWLATAVSWNISGPRYAIAVWPLFWMLARVSRRPLAAALLGAASGAGFALIAARFMSDLWAF